VEDLAAERPEVLGPAIRVGAADAGHALSVVAAENELFHHLGDALDAETPIDDRVLGLVLIDEALKMLFEQTLEGIDPARLVRPCRDWGERKG